MRLILMNENRETKYGIMMLHFVKMFEKEILISTLL